MVVEGHALAEVVLAGYLLGRPLGTAPVVIVGGGITASPFPFGDPASGADAWKLLAALRTLEGARAAIVTDSGMQAVALVIDVVLQAGGHAVVMRQVYNKTRTFLEHSARRIGARITLVDDGEHAALAAALRPETQLVFAETFTNPLTRAQDVAALTTVIGHPGRHLVLDTTIATPWALRRPALSCGARVVVGSLPKALGLCSYSTKFMSCPTRPHRVPELDAAPRARGDHRGARRLARRPCVCTGITRTPTRRGNF